MQAPVILEDSPRASRLDASSVWAVIEALEVGDVDLALEILLDIAETDRRAVARDLACPECGLRVAWPGPLADHRRFVHDVEDSEAA